MIAWSRIPARKHGQAAVCPGLEAGAERATQHQPVEAHEARGAACRLLATQPEKPGTVAQRGKSGLNVTIEGFSGFAEVGQPRAHAETSTLSASVSGPM